MKVAHPMAQPIVRAHPMAGSTCERAASRFSDAADSPPTSVVFSKCGVVKDLDLGMIWGPKPRNFSSVTLVHLLGAKNQYACNIFGFQNSSWSPWGETYISHNRPIRHIFRIKYNIIIFMIKFRINRSLLTKIFICFKFI